MKNLFVRALVALAALCTLPSYAQFVPGQPLTASQLNATLSAKTSNAAAAITGGTISGLSVPLPQASGGTGSNTALGATANLQYNQGASGATTRSVSDKLGDNPSSVDFHTVGDGTTDDSTSFRNAYAALAGKTLRIPYTGNCYFLGSNVAQTNPPVSLIVEPGVTFCGSGQLPPSTGHGGAAVIGNYFYNAPTGGIVGRDSLNLSAELDAQPGFIGNGVAFFAAAYSPTGNPNFTGHLWSINTQTTLNASTGSYNAQGIEVDVNNHYQNQAGVGTLYSGLGEFSPQAAIEIARANSTSDWNNGIWMRNFVTGILIDGSTSAAPTSGLSISGLAQNHVVLTPTSGADGGNPIFTIKCAGGSGNCFTVSANGNANGGAANFSGNLTVSASNPAAIINDTGSSQASLYFQNAGTNEWKFANTSSTNQLCLSRYVSGTNTDSPWCVSNSTGVVSFVDGITVKGTAVNPNLSATSSSLGGSALAAGACTSGTVSIAGATTSMAVAVSPAANPGTGFDWNGYVSAAGTVTVNLCAIAAGTPTATTYNVRVLQ